MRVVLFCIFLLSLTEAKAQWLPCVDSNRIDPFYQCNQAFFQPVCACNFQTYRNECAAFNVGGVNTIEHAGVCANDVFTFDIYPNPASFRINFALEFATEGPATVEIWDSFGKIMFLRNLAIVRRTDFFVDLGGYRPGVYIIVVMGAGKIEYRKFIKSDR